MMPSLTMQVPKGSPLEHLLLKELNYRVKLGEKSVISQHLTWKKAEERVLAFVPESDLDSKRNTRRSNGVPAYTTLQIPYTYALLMSAHTYWTSVFFARSPVHQYMGRHGEAENQTQALEALVDYQVSTGEAMGPYYIWLYDTGKYGLGVIGTYWDKEVFRFSEITETNDPMTQKTSKIQTTRELTGYEGTKIYNVSPFDFYPDPRVTIGNFQKGEYCFVRRRISWNDIVKREKAGYYINIDQLKANTPPDASNESYSALERPSTTSVTGDARQAKHPSVVDAYEFYIDLIPNDWQLGNSDYPEKWVITITKDLKTIFGLQPLGLIHNKFPFDVMEMEVEAYAQYNRGIPEIIEPLQNTMDWLVNTHFYNTRAVLNNLFIVDPTKVVMKDFENSEPGGMIRLKPEAYGSDINSFFKQIPITDITQSNFNDLQLIQAIGERTMGINDQIMGAMSGNGRKTATEVRTSTGFGINRLKTITEYLSATAFSQHSQKLVMNSQQFFDGEKKFRIVGSLAQEAGPSFLNVTPDSIAGFYDFVPVDGVLPADRMAQANLWKEILMNIGRVPQVAQAYDMSRIFAWMASIAGLKNINQFKIQVLPPGQMQGSPGTVPVPLPSLSAPGVPVSGGMNPDMSAMAPQPLPQTAPQDTGVSMQ